MNGEILLMGAVILGGGFLVYKIIKDQTAAQARALEAQQAALASATRKRSFGENLGGAVGNVLDKFVEW